MSAFSDANERESISLFRVEHDRNKQKRCGWQRQNSVVNRFAVLLKAIYHAMHVRLFLREEQAYVFEGLEAFRVEVH